MTRWFDVLKTTPEPPRQLTAHELQRLNRLGFSRLALAHVAGTCPDCGLNKAGTGHHDLCAERYDPQPARPQAAQPWQPRAPRQRRAA